MLIKTSVHYCCQSMQFNVSITGFEMVMTHSSNTLNEDWPHHRFDSNEYITAFNRNNQSTWTGIPLKLHRRWLIGWLSINNNTYVKSSTSPETEHKNINVEPNAKHIFLTAWVALKLHVTFAVFRDVKTFCASEIGRLSGDTSSAARTIHGFSLHPQ